MTVKCRTAKKWMFFYLNWCLSVMLNSLSCPFISISFLTNKLSFVLFCFFVFFQEFDCVTFSRYCFHCKQVYMCFRNRWKSEPLASFSALFRSKCKWILYFPTMYVYCVYPTMSKIPKQLPNCVKRAETSVILMVFDGVLSEVCAYTVTISYHGSTWIKYQKNYILFSDCI